MGLLQFGLLLLAGSSYALDLKALCPAYPLCDNALLAYHIQKENPQPAAPCPNFPLCDVHHVALAQQAGKKKRSLPVPGTTGLVPGSAAEAQWYQQQLAALAPAAPLQYTSASLPVSGTIPGLAPGSPAEAQWYQQQLAAIAAAGRKKRSLPVPGTIPGLIPGSEAEAQWYAAQLKLIALQG